MLQCICLPEASVEIVRSEELPPPKEEAARFLSESVVIALAGCDVQALHNAKFAEIDAEAESRRVLSG